MGWFWRVEGVGMVLVGGALVDDGWRVGVPRARMWKEGRIEGSSLVTLVQGFGGWGRIGVLGVVVGGCCRRMLRFRGLGGLML